MYDFIMKCPSCGNDITNQEFSVDSEVNGFINIGYECQNCNIEIFAYFVQYMREESSEYKIPDRKE